MEVISISGLGSTGSGAVEALLQEYDDIQGGMQDEFNLLYLPDGILDLEYHLCQAPERFFSSDIAINRFIHFLKMVDREPHGYYNRWTNHKFYDISMEYVEKIVQLKWTGYWGMDEYLTNNFWRTLKYRLFEKRIINPVQIKKKKRIHTFLDRTMYLSIEPDNFIQETKLYLEQLFAEMGYDLKRPIFVNQLFAGNDPCAGMQYFDDAKCIVVDRDPRDLYMFHHKKWCVICHWCPTQNIDEFVSYYRYCRKKIVNDKRILRVQFEDMVYKYDETVKIIESFLGIKEHSRIKEIFKPEISIRNTQLYVGIDDAKKDIAYIEKMLSDYLYDFSDYRKERSTLEESF
ncbi:MAG: sulfotransferase [Muribaculaceae bacterium]|nr:sulfotransferase [Roseburia sp.]MCM1431221.1 sulfotransferase [Muribaculaceae bacterium]MCM1492293.1 sulfotransferase [Muribaculaceae bacterium]